MHAQTGTMQSNLRSWTLLCAEVLRISTTKLSSPLGAGAQHLADGLYARYAPALNVPHYLQQLTKSESKICCAHMQQMAELLTLSPRSFSV